MTDESELERAIRRAFQAAGRYNRERGGREPDANIRRSRTGVRMVGPRSYRITLFLTPQLFGELDERRTRSPRYQSLSLSSFIVGELTRHAGERGATAERPAARRGG